MKRRFNYTRFCAALTANAFIFALLFAAALNSIPERIYITAGENTELNFDVPLKAEIDEAVGVIVVKNAKGEEKTDFNLASPLYVEAPEETNFSARLSLLGIPVKNVDVSVVGQKTVSVCGNVVGVTMDTKGILVLGTGEIENEKGERTDIAKGKIFPGDVILKVNGKDIEDKEALSREVENYDGGAFEITLKRRGKETKINLKPQKDSDGNKIGLWVRDSTQGLGTVTYYDTENGDFAALGHGIYDVDTGSLMEVKDGKITSANVTGYEKGKKGNPGEVTGSIDKSIVYGNINENTDRGIYGKITPRGEAKFGSNVMPIALRHDIKEGEAYIISDILGKTDEYKITVKSIDRYGGKADKSMVIKIEDERLLNETGGIIQGMSGSPIIQDGKLIGAVTHVLVNQPDTGYGIFIENMLEH